MARSAVFHEGAVARSAQQPSVAAMQRLLALTIDLLGIALVHPDDVEATMQQASRAGGPVR